MWLSCITLFVPGLKRQSETTNITASWHHRTTRTGGVWWRNALGFAHTFSLVKFMRRISRMAEARAHFSARGWGWPIIGNHVASIKVRIPVARTPPLSSRTRACHHLAPGSPTHACTMFFNRRSKKIHSEGGKRDIIWPDLRYIYHVGFSALCANVLYFSSLSWDVHL